MRRTLVLVALGVGLGLLPAGCGNDRLPPVGPTPTAPAPAPGPPRIPDDVPGEIWDLTRTFTSIAGPEVCWAPAIGRTFDEPLAVERSGESIRLRAFLHAYPADHEEYAGTVRGEEFTARWPYSGTAVFGCRNLQFTYHRVEGEVSGRFLAEGTELTAVQVWIYHPPVGETVTLQFEWKAKKR
jgi:hypothetical protein